jgi:DNA-binding IclR family transcriptional regulator
MGIIYEICRRHSIQKQFISTIARDMGLSRPTVRKHLTTREQHKYAGGQPASPKFELNFDNLISIDSTILT